MCIIVLKPKNVQFPDKTTLQNCFINNPDGAGYMFSDGNQVIIRKGFMDFPSFYKDLTMNTKRKHTVIMHFRIATAGGIHPELTHPFPISDSIKELQCLQCVTHAGVVHNGIFGAGREKVSDTMLYIMECLSDPIVYDNLSNTCIQNLIEESIGTSRLVILTSSKWYRYGDTWYNRNGVYYSNTTYLSYIALAAAGNYYGNGYKSSYVSPGRYSNYDYDNDDELERYYKALENSNIQCPACHSENISVSALNDCYECQDCFQRFNLVGEIVKY